MNITVKDFLVFARRHYRGNLKVLCALGAAMESAKRIGITGIGSINLSGMPPQTSGAAFLRLLNPRLTPEQATRWYYQVICRNDCQTRRSRAWSTLRKAALMGEHYTFVKVDETHYRPEFVVPELTPVVTEDAMLDTVNPTVDCEHPELLVAAA